MRLNSLLFMLLAVVTLTLAQTRPAEVAGVKEWDLVVERTVTVSSRTETYVVATNLIDQRDERRHCTFRVRLLPEFADESGAEWAGKGRGEGTVTAKRHSIAAGIPEDSLDQRDAAGGYDAEATLQINLETRRYRFEVQGGEGMKGTVLTRKRGKERSSPHTETCSAGVTEQPLPASGTTLSGTVTKETPMSGSSGGVRAAGAQRVTTTWTLKPRGRVMAKLFIEPGPGYATWLPAGSDTDSPLGLGSSQLVRLVLEGENGKPATVIPTRVRVWLVEVSREKGISLNWPRNGGTEPDLFFRRERMDNVREVRNEGQEAILEGGMTQWTVPVYSNDYGAFGKLMAEAELPGGVIVSGEVRGAPSLDRLALPKDDNENRIADVWERSVGARSTDPESDDDDTRPAMAMKGDGLTLYEEYRGLRTVDALHQRLDPNRPDFFFIDDARLVDVVQWESITGFAAHRLEWQHMRFGEVPLPLDATRSIELRHVDHNEGHAKGRQAHAVWVYAHRGLGDAMQLIFPTEVNKDRLASTIALSEATDKKWAPKTTRLVYLNVDRLAQFANAGLEAELRSRATGPDRDSTNNKWDVTPKQAQVLADRLKAEARAVGVNARTYLTKAMLHELSHSVGLDEHQPHPNLGAQSCLINYPPHGALAQRLLGGFPPQTLCSADTCQPRLRLLPP